WWHEHIVGDGGPCAWALETDDVAAEAQRARALGITVAGPTHVFRDRPDGTRVEWDQVILGDHGMGALLPFVLKDRTPRHYRVKPSVSVAGTELKAVGLVVLGIADLDRASKLFQHLYDLPLPTVCKSSSFAATVAHFENQPFALATPSGPQGWLHKRLMRLGDSPCACLIGTTDFAASKKRFLLGKVETWFDRQVAWFGTAAFDRLKIGLVEL
ncbi:MAG: VOC family protein, partial [Acidiferrobacterales bacterium]